MENHILWRRCRRPSSFSLLAVLCICLVPGGIMAWNSAATTLTPSTRTLGITSITRCLSSRTLRPRIQRQPKTRQALLASISSSSNDQEAEGEEITVAIIGGGIAGLTCAQYLSKLQQHPGNGKSVVFRPTVFDTGRLRPGGRCSSRWPDDPDKDGDSNNGFRKLLQSTSTIVDHAAQILTVPEGFPEFQAQVDVWEKEGTIAKYPENTVCDIVGGQKDGDGPSFQLQPINHPSSGTPMYYGTKGMGSIPLRIAQDVHDLKQDVWVAPSNGVRYQKETNRWKLQAKGQTLGIFDRIVIAHNGKCADRIMSQTPAKLVHNLLKVNFASSVSSKSGGGKRMTLNSIYSLSFAVPRCSPTSVLNQALPAHQFVCGFIQNEPSLRFLTCHNRKFNTHNQNDRDDADDGNNVDVWTVLSSPSFAKKHKAPQEFLPDEVIENVTSLMLQGLEHSLNLPQNALQDQVLESRLQLWGAAVPLNVWTTASKKGNTGFLYDGKFGVGVCGDWLLDPSIAGAWDSGRRLAEYMIQTSSSSSSHHSTTNPKKPPLVGVKGSFHASEGSAKAGIGSFPGRSKQQQQQQEEKEGSAMNR